MGNIRENGGKITNSIDFTDKNREALELEVGKSNFEIFGEDWHEQKLKLELYIVYQIEEIFGETTSWAVASAVEMAPSHLGTEEMNRS